MADGTFAYPQAGAGRMPAAGEDGFPVAVKRISWGSVFAGVVVATVGQLLFALLGLGIGLSAVDPTRNPCLSRASASAPPCGGSSPA